MTIRSILCIFGGLPEELNALNTAFALAALHQAQIKFLHISPDIYGYMGMYGDMMVGSPLINGIEEENRARLERAKKFVESSAAKHHVALDEDQTPQHHVAARFIHRSGVIADIVSEEGCLSDMIVMSRGITAAETSEDPAVLAALFDTGRPLILLPATQQPAATSWQDRKIAVAWDGSVEASRALYGARPYIGRAEALYILRVRDHDSPRETAAMTGALDYVQTHTSKAPQLIFIKRGPDSAAQALLRKTQELKIDLLVMGAFGHSRFREMLLGGTTRFMLGKADLPLLLAH